MASNTPRVPGRHFLQIPGPAPVPDRILRAMDKAVLDHRGPEFQQLRTNSEMTAERAEMDRYLAAEPDKTLALVAEMDMGEPDLVKALLTLPGITTVGEGASGFNVRGGNVDENLIIMDEAPVFNASQSRSLLSISRIGGAHLSCVCPFATWFASKYR